VVFPRYCREKQQHPLQNKKTFPQALDKKNKIKQTLRKTHRRSKDLKKTNKSHRQRIQEQNQKKGLRHLRVQLIYPPLRHLLFILILPRQQGKQNPQSWVIPSLP
jgi:RNase adaptor protein for sRNA GlmZ degradation